MRVLVVNAGSSSLKLRLLDADDQLVATKDLPDSGSEPADELASWIGTVGQVDAVGHRIVHGGTEFREAVLIDAEVRARIEALTDLAPLHQPKALSALDAVSACLPRVPAVAAFDTAFHASLPAAAATYAIPREWRTRWPLRRFGFHGLSHAYAARRTAVLLNRPLDALRLVTCHLGAGASLAAVQGGRSVDTTMGFTPLEGLVMATRSGSVDPGLVLWLQDHVGILPGELASTLERRSGLLGLTGSVDLREVLEAEASGDADAALGISVYLHRLRGAIASMAAAMNGLDALVFTGGVGEHSAEIRQHAAHGLGFLGVAIHPERNLHGDGDREIGSQLAAVRSLVVHAREDLEIARQVRALLGD
ncbi:MAG: acetate/propionate family kinase [Chloroflexota bacterium]|nr:acetate/propionate family kinase [Chloroflexota bacterium]